MIAHPVGFTGSQSGWGDTWDSVSVAPAVVVRAVRLDCTLWIEAGFKQHQVERAVGFRALGNRLKVGSSVHLTLEDIPAIPDVTSLQIHIFTSKYFKTVM